MAILYTFIYINHFTIMVKSQNTHNIMCANVPLLWFFHLAVAQMVKENP